MKSPQVDLESLGELEETSGFDWIRFIDREGSDYTSNGKFAEVSDREYYQEGIAGKSGICIVMKSRVNQKRLVGFYAPVYYQGEVCGVMVGFLQESTVSQILATELYGSNVGTMIVDISGTVLGKDGKKETADIEMIDDILPLLDENEQQSVKNALKNKDKTQYDYTDEMGSSVGYLVPDQTKKEIGSREEQSRQGDLTFAECIR
ncbi:MAG: cache domain-containing protein [Lachnospiraceae bacterium]|nr:cache domain-containing protein [Lachnospiraceae bacterium]